MTSLHCDDEGSCEDDEDTMSHIKTPLLPGGGGCGAEFSVTSALSVLVLQGKE